VHAAAHHGRTACRAAACLLAVVTALSACSSGAELDLEGFAPGACSTVAPTLQQIDAALREVDDEELSPSQAADRFRTAQDELKSSAPSAAAQVRPAITELVTRLGFYRITVDSNGDVAAQADEVRTALEALAEDCRQG
jgi:Tfp pilus assembly protein PilP